MPLSFVCDSFFVQVKLSSHRRKMIDKKNDIRWNERKAENCHHDYIAQRDTKYKQYILWQPAKEFNLFHRSRTQHTNI